MLLRADQPLDLQLQELEQQDQDLKQVLQGQSYGFSAIVHKREREGTVAASWLSADGFSCDGPKGSDRVFVGPCPTTRVLE
jgi:hypothetical protein